MIQAQGLVKRYKSVLAVDGLSFEVRPGVVTGFLGPNGSGKSTTMRLILGLDRPQEGGVRVNGRSYHDLPWPLREVGALLEARSFHPGRSAYDHLLWLAQTNSLPKARVDEVLEIVGLTPVAQKRAGKFSLGMGQRLGIAGALLGDPGVLLFDEPVNGLDPEGIRWVRLFLRHLAAEGRTVFVSSHLMNEMAVTADHVVVIGKGRLIADAPVSDVLKGGGRGERSRVRTPKPAELSAVLGAAGASISPAPGDALDVVGIPTAAVGDLALANGIALHELTPETISLEQAFMDLTTDSVEYRGSGVEGLDPEVDRGATPPAPVDQPR